MIGRFIKSIVVLATLVVLFQNCSDPDFNLLKTIQSVEIRGESSYVLDPPVDADKISRFVYLVDMSFSMISAPCAQDVDENILFNREESGRPVNAWDPNKFLPQRSPLDYQRVAAYDCYVDPSLTSDDYPVPFELAQIRPGNIFINSTVPGSDIDANRLSVLRQWIDQLRNNLKTDRRAAAKVMVVPFTTGRTRDRLHTFLNYDYRFIGLDDPKLDQLIRKLYDVHEDTFEKASDADDYFRWENRKMGASSPMEVLDPVYREMLADMKNLASYGILRKSTYNLFYVSDGILTPTAEIINTAIQTHYKCTECTVDSKDCENVCLEIREELVKTLGAPEENTKMSLALRMGRIQALPERFGAGRVNNYFMQINESFVQKVYQGVENLFDIYAEIFERFNYRFKYFVMDEDKLPFDLAVNQTDQESLYLTSVILINPNLRINDSGGAERDSDGDGLFDELEVEEGTDPLNPRTNGFCLDGLLANPAYRSKCQALTSINNCDPFLDTDMDSLNECEEKLLGTNTNDFDTDGDFIPDFYEYLYGFNPLISDTDKDSNADGLTNFQAFLKGLGPQQDVRAFDESFGYKFTLSENALNATDDTNLWQRDFTMKVDSIPYIKDLKYRSNDQTSDLCQMYFTRLDNRADSCAVNGISETEHLYHVNTEVGTNTGIILLRLKDKNNEEDLSWRILKFSYLNNSENKSAFELDKFSEFLVLDELE